MSWESDREWEADSTLDAISGSQGGSLKPGYTVEEPITPEEEGGFEIPRGGDDELLEMIESWQGASPEQVATQFNERGDDLLESFLHRHEADLADGVERRLREYLRALEAMGARYFDEGGATGAPAKLKHLLQTQVVPIVKDVLRAAVRQKQARGGRDHVPGRASEARDQRDISARQLASERIEASVRRMDEYSRVQEYQSQALHGLSVEDEMNMHTASKEILKRQIFLWDEANRLNQGAFSSTITRLQRELKKTEDAIHQTRGALVYGDSRNQAQRDREAEQGLERARKLAEKMDREERERRGQPLPPRPWDKKERWGFADTGPQEYKETKVRGKVSLEQRLVPGSKDAQYLNEILEIGVDNPELYAIEAYTDFVHPIMRLAHGYGLVSDELWEMSTHHKLHMSGGLGDHFGKITSVDLSPQKMRVLKDNVKRVISHLRKIQPTAPTPARMRAPVPTEGSSSGSRSASGSGSRSSSSSSGWRRFDEEVQVVDDDKGDFLGYVMPFSEPQFYEKGYGVRARDVVDLFSVFHRHLDYKSTVKSIITLMSNADPKFGLDKILPDSISRLNMNWAGRTLGDILKTAGIKSKQAGARGEVDAHHISEKFASVLIKQGSPSGKPAKGKAADASARANAVRPNGLLIEMFNAWRPSAAAQRAGLDKTDALQLFSYHRTFSVGKRGPSVSGGPSAFREGVEKMGLDRTKLKLIGSLFGTRAGESSFNPEFWAKSMQDQLAWMKSHQKGHNAYKTNNWIKVLEGAFGVDVEGQLGIATGGVAGSYNAAARERIWGAVSAKMKQFMSMAGITSAEAGDYLAAYAAGVTPSPGSERVRYGVSRRDRSREPEEEGSAEPPKKRKRQTQQDAKQLDKLGLKPFPKPGSYPPKRPGSHLYKQWAIQLSELPGRAGDNLAHVSETLEGQIFTQLLSARGRRLKHWEDDAGRKIPSQFNLYTNLVGVRTNADYQSFKVFLDKAAWNEYIGSGWMKPPDKRDEYLFKDIPDHKFIFEQVFRPDKDDFTLVSDLLQKWLGARIWNLNTKKGLSAENPAGLLLNVKKNWDHEFKVVAEGYQKYEAFYAKAEKQFPVPDWKDRLFKGNQIDQLNHIFDEISSMEEAPHAPYKPVRPSTPEPEGDEKSPEEKQGEVPARKPRKSPEKKRGPRGPRVERGRPLDIPLDEPAEEVAAAPLPQAAVEVVELDPLMDLAAEDEADIERYYARVHLPIRSHSNQLRAEVVQRQNYEALNAVHLMQTDNDVQPAMGAVHIVHPASNFSDKHFMYDVEGDINEGQKVLVERSKRGPFRQQSGRSTVMDRSAHVTYRKRAGAFEITVRRGAINAELQQMLSKLSMHRMSVHGSHVVIIKGTKRYRLGPLAEINLRYLRELVDECLQQYGSCGLEITETRAGRGAIYKAGAHSAQFKSNARKKRGPATRRR